MSADKDREAFDQWVLTQGLPGYWEARWAKDTWEAALKYAREPAAKENALKMAERRGEECARSGSYGGDFLTELSQQRELLELAAKACSLDWRTFKEYVYAHDDPDGVWPYEWNPLTNDDDCARMEAALEIDIYWHENEVIAEADDAQPKNEWYTSHAYDKQAARRMASVKVAAEIGKGMKDE